MSKIVLSSGKRKTAVARATIKPGTGKIRINGLALEAYPNRWFRIRIQEPLIIAGEDIVNSVDIRVRVHGGGVSGQAEAIRMAIARGLVEYTQDSALRAKFFEYERTMISGDPRQTWPKRFGGRKARARKQKSYR